MPPDQLESAESMNGSQNKLNDDTLPVPESSCSNPIPPAESCYNCGRYHSPSEIEVHIRADDFDLEPQQVLLLLQESTDPMISRGFSRIRTDLVVKCRYGTRPVEAQSSEFARQHTSIRIPKVFLVFCSQNQVYIVSEFVAGTALRDCWGSMDATSRQDIATQISSYIWQLRNIQPAPSCPGPLDKTCAWKGRWFTEYGIEPLDSYQALVDWLNHKREVSKRAHPSIDTPLFSTEHPLVFTHGDIAPRNFIVDKDKRLWLLDWDLAGWYPAYMEYATIAVEINDSESPFAGLEEWIQAVSGAIEPYERELHMLKSITWALQFAPLA